MVIPHLYDGHNKTFFFFSYEGFRSVLPVPNSGTFTTVPNASDRIGDFSKDLGAQVNCGGGPCKDGLGNPVYAGEIFDPLNVAADGFTRFPFPNNTIPANRIDPVALKMLGFLPKPVNSLQALNYQLSGTTPRPQNLPSVKVDHNVSPALKLSAFYSYVGGSGQTSTDGLPTNITTAGFNTSRSSTARLNVDDSLRPSMLLHFGVGLCEYDRHQVRVSGFAKVRPEGSTRTYGRDHERVSADERSRQFFGERRPHRRYDSELRVDVPSRARHRRIHFVGVAELGETVAHVQIRRQHAYPHGSVQPVPGRLGCLRLLRRADRPTLRGGRRDAGDDQRIARARLCQLPSRDAEFGHCVALHQRELARPGDRGIRAGQLEGYATAYGRVGHPVRSAESAGGRPEPDQLVLADHTQSEHRQSAGSGPLPGLRPEYLQLRQSAEPLQIRLRAAHRRGVPAHSKDGDPGRVGLLLRCSRHVCRQRAAVSQRRNGLRHDHVFGYAVRGVGAAERACRADFPSIRRCSIRRCTSRELFRRRIRLRV